MGAAESMSKKGIWLQCLLLTVNKLLVRLEIDPLRQMLTAEEEQLFVNPQMWELLVWASAMTRKYESAAKVKKNKVK